MGSDEECELFGEVPAGHEANLTGMQSDGEEHRDELDNAAASRLQKKKLHLQHADPMSPMPQEE